MLVMFRKDIHNEDGAGGDGDTGTGKKVNG
jgi:hypothetical protein